jgi:deoxyinosine 3'endonuclease (endonuclease V)
MLTDENENKHIYISIGHRISLKTATEIVHRLSKYETP